MEASRRLSDQQRERLRDLYESNFVRVLRLCRRLLRDPDDAADAAHEVFVRAAGSYQERLPGEDAGPWLLTVARNYCMDVLRRRQCLGRLMVTLSPDADDHANPETSVVEHEAMAAIFEQLRTRERLALWQSVVERRSVAAIANDLGLSYMATAQLLHRARRHAAMLAKRLAAIFGLLQLGRFLRRATQGVSIGARQALAAAALPVVVVVAIQSSSSGPSAIQSPPLREGQGRVPPIGSTSVPDGLTLPGPRPLDLLDQTAPTVVGVVQQATPGVSSTLDSVTKSVIMTTTSTVGGVLGRRI